MRRPLYSDVKAVRAVNTTAVAANGNTDGTSIGLDQSGADFRSVMFVLLGGTITDGTYTMVPQESPTGSGSWTNVPSDRLLGSGAVTASNGVAEIGMIPDATVSPFVRLRVTATVVTTGGGISAVGLLGEPSNYPVSHS